MAETDEQQLKQQASRSPSPASRPPIPATPGPRATALQKLYGDAIAHVLKTCSYHNFSACFPTPAQQVSGSFKLLHEQFVEKLGDSMRREFDGILEERGVVTSLNELDGLVDDARRRKQKAAEEGGESAPTPPHTLPAQSLYNAHLLPSLNTHNETISSRQETLANENIELLSRVMEQRKQIVEVVKGLENVVADLDSSVASLQNRELDDLRDEVRAVDEDMRMTA